MPPFTPSKALPRSPALLTYISGDITDKIAIKLLQFLPAITSTSTIHDNACGTGAITKAILSSSPPPGYHLYATDINPAMISSLQAEASAHAWPLSASVMPAQQLDFDNDVFSHSVNSFVIHLVEQDAQAVQHVCRTLKPGGAALFSIWRDPILARVARAAHRETRGGGEALPALKRGDFDEEALRRLLGGSEFGAEGLRWSQVREDMVVEDLRQWVTAAWSLLGQTGRGWLEEDEGNWEKAVEVMLQTVEEWEGYEKLADGSVKLSMVADVVVAVKPQ
ncbi:S-adenosyl-L-methionine-dependent methyltransferase [Polyplosphaeria fusca]|uniref:S-adenosyl-L-methionine-dependent methyltransferase n=1 Tax=Polyplosphaeria fusca TaxID=682080 RepID=A0A9P4UYB8_9PLEO|nr:S-adenosyl-L-methionine-dependent methyltransferase [Polyplosphaeria fusca]